MVIAGGSRNLRRSWLWLCFLTVVDEIHCRWRSDVAWTTSEEVEEASMHDSVGFGRRIGWLCEVEMSVQTGGGGELLRSWPNYLCW